MLPSYGSELQAVSSRVLLKDVPEFICKSNMQESVYNLFKGFTGAASIISSC